MKLTMNVLRIVARQARAHGVRFYSKQREIEYAERSRRFLDNIQPSLPKFMVQGSSVKPLLSPGEFYEEIKHNIRTAKKTVTLAALYLGSSEAELIDTLKDALRSRPELKVNLLLDGLRGTRDTGKGSSASLLLPLVNSFPGRVQVSMYHTPDLRGVVKQVLPPRWNEGIGLMHMKVYAFDETLIMSGANMSKDYFTNRQDRYIKIKNADVTEYFTDLVSAVSSFSYNLESRSDTFEMGRMPRMPDPVDDSEKFKKFARKQMYDFMTKWSRVQQTPKDGSFDTSISPVIQMGPLGIKQDERVTLSVLDHVLHKGLGVDRARLVITSGYFNFEDSYRDTIVKAKANVRLIAASPEANGFFGSRGISKYIPPAYTLIEKRFLEAVKRFNNHSNVAIEEYHRPGWTYHAKGLWVYPDHSELPVITSIGSPNFGYRSVMRDLEAQMFIITTNEVLRTRLHEELHSLRDYTYKVDDDTFEEPARKVPFWVGSASRLIKTML